MKNTSTRLWQESRGHYTEELIHDDVNPSDRVYLSVQEGSIRIKHNIVCDALMEVTMTVHFESWQ